jgi:CHRD domain-containing protein
VRRRLQLTAVVAVIAALGVGAVAVATNGGTKFQERLTGYEETPLALSTSGNGKFDATLSRRSEEIRYTLSYRALEGNVTQAHIHFGARAQSGGISVFLCTNLDNGPAGTQACPAAPATISGTLRATDVIGPAGQGITAGQFRELSAAMEAGVTYVNVHSTLYPAGEIRAQLEDRGRGH